jgi:hypothetical protein
MKRGEKKDATGCSKMVHAVCLQRQLRLVKFSVVPTQNFTLEYIIASGRFADFFCACCVLSHCSRLEVWQQRQLRLVKVSIVPTTNFTLEYIIESGRFADFFSACCVLSHCSRLEVWQQRQLSWLKFP